MFPRLIFLDDVLVREAFQREMEGKIIAHGTIMDGNSPAIKRKQPGVY
jgi:hypothetical protein